MIVREFYRIREDGASLFKTYSNDGFKIQQVDTNEIYNEAIDIETANFEYIETQEKIENIDEVVNAEDNSDMDSTEDLSTVEEQDVLTMLEEVF